MPKTVEFFYDFSSPNAYFASVQLPRLVDRLGASIVWKPFLLGGLFKMLGTPMTPMMTNPNKAKASTRDLERWAKKYEIPFSFPSNFPMNTVKALRCVIAIESGGGDPSAFINATFREFWVDDGDISDLDVLGTLLDECGAEASRVREAIASQEVKQALQDATSKAVERGVFGAPTFFVEDELFFGKDRLDFVEDALRGR